MRFRIVQPKARLILDNVNADLAEMVPYLARPEFAPDDTDRDLITRAWHKYLMKLDTYSGKTDLEDYNVRMAVQRFSTAASAVLARRR